MPAQRPPLPESVRRYRERMRCPEATQHGPLDAYGRCPWCRRKVEATRPAPAPAWGPYAETELTAAYGEHYDPDHGALSRDQIRARYEMGQTP